MSRVRGREVWRREVIFDNIGFQGKCIKTDKYLHSKTSRERRPEEIAGASAGYPREKRKCKNRTRSKRGGFIRLIWARNIPDGSQMERFTHLNGPLI